MPIDQSMYIIKTDKEILSMHVMVLSCIGFGAPFDC